MGQKNFSCLSSVVFSDKSYRTYRNIKLFAFSQGVGITKLSYLFFTARFDAFLTCWQCVRTGSDGFSACGLVNEKTKRWKKMRFNVSMMRNIENENKNQNALVSRNESFFFELKKPSRNQNDEKIICNINWARKRKKCYLLPKWFLITNILH